MWANSLSQLRAGSHQSQSSMGRTLAIAALSLRRQKNGRRRALDVQQVGKLFNEYPVPTRFILGELLISSILRRTRTARSPGLLPNLAVRP